MALVKYVAGLARDLERRIILGIFGRPQPPLDYAFDCPPESPTERRPAPFGLKDLIGDGFLYAVPKHRRSAQKGIERKFGWPHHFWKHIKPKTNIKTCNDCGHHHEVGVLCSNCYSIVMKETKEMQKKIQEKLQLNPVENEVVVLYDGEKMDQPDEFWNGMRVVEMEKPRPPWFSKNLLQKTTQQPSTSTDVKPTELA